MVGQYSLVFFAPFVGFTVHVLSFLNFKLIIFFSCGLCVDINVGKGKLVKLCLDSAGGA